MKVVSRISEADYAQYDEQSICHSGWTSYRLIDGRKEIRQIE